MKVQPDNTTACESISNKLNEVARQAEALDNILKESNLTDLEVTDLSKPVPVSYLIAVKIMMNYSVLCIVTGFTPRSQVS